MKKLIFLAVAAIVFASVPGSAQERYTYTVNTTRTYTIPINWRPDSMAFQRYTVAVSPFYPANGGMKFDFEYELPRPGHWIQTSVIGYLAPARDGGRWYYDGGNNRGDIRSGFDGYSRMWGLGTSALFKNMFSPRGWYFSTGLKLEFFRVGVMTDTYLPYNEDGLTFYDAGRRLEAKSYFRPTAQINIGKHMALSRRCFFDLYVGLGLTYPLYRNDYRHTYDGYGWRTPLFTDAFGFAFRGIVPTGGFRFGVLLWKPEN